MKWSSLWTPALLYLVFSAACSKTNTEATSQLETNTPVDSSTTVIDTSVTIGDTLSLVAYKWSSYEDSVSSINYADPGGAPISGALFNPSTDYWDFEADGTLHVVLQGTPYASTYEILPSSQMRIPALLYYYQKRPCTITTLNDTAFIFVFTDTSSTGTYYRRVWLKRN